LKKPSPANKPKFMEIIEASRRSYREQGGIPLEALRDELGLKPKRNRGRKQKKR